jgi:hypothetical protein
MTVQVPNLALTHTKRITVQSVVIPKDRQTVWVSRKVDCQVEECYTGGPKLL